ncbi:MAG: UDP-N-acetylglucosamine 2-epimerase (non-hydrolyzing) [Thermoanaerobaculia bacterium]
MKVLTVVGTRPEVIKLSRVVAELERHTRHRLVHTGQNYDPELNRLLFEELGMRPPDELLACAGRTPSETISKVIAGVDEVLERERPDALLVYGDTNSCYAVIPAKRRQIPVFHMEAGNRSFDQRVPEEINRKVIDHLSDINLPLTEHARRYLLAEGVRPETVIVTGSPMPEVLAHHAPGIAASRALTRLGLESGAYLLVSVHREENVDDPGRLAKLLETLAALAGKFGLRIVMSTHPRTRVRLEALAAERGADALPKAVEMLKPFGFCDWVRLQSEAFCVLSDSGTLTEEAALLGFPAVMLREAHERPEGMDAGVTLMAGIGRERVIQAVTLVTEQRRAALSTLAPPQVPDYALRPVSRQIVRIIVGHVDYVQHTVWRRP